MSDDAPFQPERLAGAPHPRDTGQLIGQDAAETAFLDAFNSGRLHHAWLLTGPRGVGKATLAWRIARFLLATPRNDGGMFAPEPPTTLDISSDHPVAQRMASGGEGRLRNVTRTINPDTKKPRNVISVHDIRALMDFFHQSVPDGGYRVVIVDDADLMNTSAANAFLKILEEPPKETVILLLSHQTSGLLPTIRSRCRTLPLVTLAPNQVAQAMAQAGVETDNATGLATLAEGSVGGAMQLALLGGAEIYAEIVAIAGTMPQMDRTRALRLAEAATTRGAEAKRDLTFRLIDLFLARLARSGALGQPPSPEAVPGEASVIARLAPTPAQARIWADLAAEVSARVSHGLAVNLDPAALLLDTLLKMRDAAPR